MNAMTILVLNSGSSSLKFALFEPDGSPALRRRLRGAVRHFGASANCEWRREDGTRGSHSLRAADAGEATVAVIEWLQRAPETARWMQSLDGVGHRVVHGGNDFVASTRLDASAIAVLRDVSTLAPLHNPPALAAIDVVRRTFPAVPMVAVFDTAFFHAMPDYARVYALPREWDPQRHLRRFGFHGIAHRYMHERYVEMSGRAAAELRVITLQLGQGCSVAAIQGGSPVDTSMGATPLEGLVMATRSGDLDPGLLLDVMEERSFAAREASEALNRKAGLLGLSGITDSMRELLALEATDASAALAVNAFCHRARKYLGAYLAVLGGADAVVFGGGIGENAPAIRERICSGMAWCGLALDADANGRAAGTEARISARDSKIDAFVLPVDEESFIAGETVQVLKRPGA
jgi:acetate kinase